MKFKYSHALLNDRNTQYHSLPPPYLVRLKGLQGQSNIAHGAVISYNIPPSRTAPKGLLEALLEVLSLFSEICPRCLLVLFLFFIIFAYEYIMHYEHSSLLMKTFQCWESSFSVGVHVFIHLCWGLHKLLLNHSP